MTPPPPSRPSIRYGLALGVLLLLAACDDKPKAVEAPVRPVLSVVARPAAPDARGFSGTVEPRYRVQLGFQVLGRLIARNAEVGDAIRAGVVLAAIDPAALELAVRSSAADLATARAKLENATGTEARQRYLSERNVTSQSQFESAQEGQEAAQAGVQRAAAAFAKAREQLDQAQLRSDTDGVVTQVSAQVGQVLTPGQAVMTVARPDVREAVVDVPDEVARALRTDTPFEVALQLDPAVRVPGRVREIGVQADAATRTRRVLITLEGKADLFRLGTTITAFPRTTENPAIVLPRAALLERDGQDLVWVVDPAAGTVATRSITVSRRDAESFQVADGLAPDTRVVVAGVHSLKPGQRVQIPGKAP